MALRTNYKNEVLNPGEDYRKYNIMTEGGEVIQRNIHLARAYSPQQEGDDFGASDINATNTKVNELDSSVKEKASAKELTNLENSLNQEMEQFKTTVNNDVEKVTNSLGDQVIFNLSESTLNIRTK